MARKKGAKPHDKGQCKAIYDMYCVGVRVNAICKHYKMKQTTVSNIIRRNKKSKPNNKMGRPSRLSPRGMPLLQRYLLDNCFDPLYTIVAKFNATTKLHLSESRVRRYVRNLNIHSRIAVQKPFLSKNNMCARDVWDTRTKIGRSNNGLR